MSLVCNFCKSERLQEVFSLRQVPFAQNFVFDDLETATHCDVASINLFKCLKCGTIFNSAFRGELIVYNDQYQNEQQHSVVFQNHLAEVVSLIKQRFANNDDLSVTEIGCGKGYFVKSLLDAGYRKVVGYDAAYEGNEPNIIKSLFGPGLGIGTSDLLVLRHVLEHIEEPFDFLCLLAEANNYQGKIYIEVPDFTWIYENKAFWDFYHEHVNYFDKNFFLRNFENPEVVSLFGGQYLGVFLDLSSIKTRKPYVGDDLLVDSAIFEKSLSTVTSAFSKFNKIYMWGASSKGVILSNYLDHERSKIANLIDINPRKWNKFIPVTGHKIISPEDFNKLELSMGSVVIVANKNYKNEIRALVQPSVEVFCIEELI